MTDSNEMIHVSFLEGMPSRVDSIISEISSSIRNEVVPYEEYSPRLKPRHVYGTVSNYKRNGWKHEFAFVLMEELTDIERSELIDKVTKAGWKAEFSTASNIIPGYRGLVPPIHQSNVPPTYQPVYQSPGLPHGGYDTPMTLWLRV